MTGILIFAAIIGGGIILFFYASLKNPEIISAEIEKEIINKATAYGIEPAIVMAIVKVESNFDPRACNPTDPSYGLMQITPALAYDYKLISDYKNLTNYRIELIYDIKNNLDVGCWFLSRLLKKYPFDQAIQSYNVGERGYYLGRRNPVYLEKVKKEYEYYKQRY